MIVNKFLEKNFKKLAENKKLSHAYLFFGEEENEEKFFSPSRSRIFWKTAFLSRQKFYCAKL